MVKYGLLGETLRHSLSPRIHNEVYKLMNIEAEYSLVEVPQGKIGDVFSIMSGKCITGFNVTIPYKENLYCMVDILDEPSKEIGAINTVNIKDGLSYGYNTDWIGAVRMLENEGYSLAGKEVVIIGSGGSAKALIYGYHQAGTNQITVAGRNVSALAGLKQRFPYIKTISLSELHTIKADLVVNTTPLGMYPNIEKSPIGIEYLTNFKTAADIVYNPLHTRFLKDAAAVGLSIIPGIMMLVEQAIAADEIWFDRRIDVSMETILEAIS